MSRQFATPIDLMGFELLNVKAELLASNPAGLGTGDKGRFWFNTSQNRFLYWNGSGAVLEATDSALLGGQNSAYHLNRANQTGTQVASTISDLAATVQAYRLDQFAAPTGAVAFGSQRITGLGDPSGAQDAATRAWVEAQLAGLASGQVLKGAVKVAATTNINTASGPATIDGIAVGSGDLVLLTGQTTGSQNGPYVHGGTGAAMTRASNWDTSAEAVLGSYWIVQQGTNADTFAMLTNDSAITLNTTVPTFVFRGAAGSSYTAGDGLALSGSVFNVGAGAGISVAADSVAIDTAVVKRKVTGIIPATSSGVFTVSGSTVTVNHALGNSAPELVCRYYTSPGSGNTQGAIIEVENVASDANNLVITLPGAPAANQYVITIGG